MTNYRRVLMRCTSGGSNKFYEIVLEEQDKYGYFPLATRYGKCRGDWENEGGKRNVKMHSTHIQAWGALLKILRSKESKGYFIVADVFNTTKPTPKPKLSKRDLIVQKLMGGSFK